METLQQKIERLDRERGERESPEYEYGTKVSQSFNMVPRIIDFFRRHPEEWFTPHDIRTRVYGQELERPLLTSVRREITNLTKDNRLIKSDKKDKVGAYPPALNHTWRFAPSPKHAQSNLF